MPLIDLAQYTYSAIGPVRVRATGVDVYAGLRGHAYIAARNLATPAPRLAHNTPGQLAAVLNIQAAAHQKRRHALIATAPFWDMSDDASMEHLHQLIDLEEAEA